MTIGKLPDLTFPTLECGELQTPLNLRALLFIGGAAAKVRQIDSLIDEGKLGLPIDSRIGLVKELHGVIHASLVAGGSIHSARKNINSLRTMYSWIDEAGLDITLDNVPSVFRLWTDTLLDRVRLRQIKENTAYGHASSVAALINAATESNASLLRTTRLRFTKRSSRAVNSVNNDKQNLAETFSFGHLLVDVIKGLSGESLWAPLPVTIPLRTGIFLEEWSHLRAPSLCATLKEGYSLKANSKRIMAARKAWSDDKTLRTRSSLLNMRIEAELLVFIAQTGMNLTQAYKLKLRQFSFKSSIDGYEIRDYKNRRQGAVLFEIFADYKKYFEEYLAWRNALFPTSDELFPLIRFGRSNSSSPVFHQIKRTCVKAGIPYLGPRHLRMTRINWLLRESRDPTLTAEQAQHTKETLFKVYEKPSMQVAMREIIQFWPELDPSLKKQQPCLVPGVCDGNPDAIKNLPVGAPQPDCIHPAGCLFCDKHRDIDSEDYVWSTTSMHYFKKLVLKTYLIKPELENKSTRWIEMVLEVLVVKLNWFSESNDTRAEWVKESRERINEGYYHPHWRALIEGAEVI
jgi:integrase